jgi:hypothetical protein
MIKYLSRKEASEFLTEAGFPTSIGTLSVFACKGGGLPIACTAGGPLTINRVFFNGQNRACRSRRVPQPSIEVWEMGSRLNRSKSQAPKGLKINRTGC